MGMLVQDWQAAGHGAEEAWLDAAHTWGPWLAAGLLVVVVGRALLRGSRYSAVAALDEADRAALKAKVTEQEARTSAEIVVVVVERCDPHPDAAWKAAVSFALFGTLACAGLLPWDHPALVLASEVGFGLVGALLARALPDFARAFVGETRATAVAEEQAVQEFQRAEVAQLADRDGVLILVTLFERRVIVLADEGVQAALGANADAAWIDVDGAVIAGLREESLRAGLERGIERAGDRLAEALPAGEARPNRVADDVEIRRE